MSPLWQTDERRLSVQTDSITADSVFLSINV